MMKIVIIGGVAGGMSAATRLRRLNEDAEIIVLEKGPFVSFANCGLPYYISGDIQERSDLWFKLLNNCAHVLTWMSVLSAKRSQSIRIKKK